MRLISFQGKSTAQKGPIHQNFAQGSGRNSAGFIHVHVSDSVEGWPPIDGVVGIPILHARKYEDFLINKSKL